MKQITALTSFFILFSFYTYSQTISITDARSKSIGTIVNIKGIILNGSELGTIRYIQDNTGGIAVYDSKLLTSKRGDEINLTGTLTDYNNLLEISSVSTFSVLSSDNALPEPKELSLQDGFNEKYEGRLLKFKDVMFSESGTFKGNTNYKISNGSLTKQIRIDKNSNIASTNIPSKAITIVGIMDNTKQIIN